jgi:PD-(D/E)XK endonuclease
MEKSQARPLPRRPATNPAVTKQRYALPPKRRGEIAELAFMQKAVSLGLGVAKPWGDSDRYDYILDAGRRFWRVQVRSTAYESRRGYAVHTYVYVKRKMVALTADDIDCIIAYIVPLNLWYVLPVESFSPCKNLWFYPHGSKKGSRFETFREAWWLLSPELKEAGGEHASV